MLIYKDEKGKVIKDEDHTTSMYPYGDEGTIWYKGKEVGEWTSESDSKLGSYFHLTIKDKEFHDHYFTEKDIIKACNL